MRIWSIVALISATCGDPGSIGASITTEAYAVGVENKLDVAYAVGALGIAAVLALIAVDILTGYRISAVFGKAPVKLSVVSRETSEAS